ncbi:MAG: MATE family efflux transporter [Eubacteriales bacterium]|nr:MATE family efflux transporter [Eubacteriales bacterium]
MRKDNKLEKKSKGGRQVDLLHGPILKTLAKLSLPIMATSFLQVAYNLIDTYWIARMGPARVAGVGTAGMFLWLSEGILLLSRMGGQVYTARELGAGNREEARKQAASSLSLSLLLGLIMANLLFFFRGNLIAFFHLPNAETIRAAEVYLAITGFGIIFAYIGRHLTALAISSGDSKTPFKINTVGLVTNMILDPILIFALGWGVAGAAWATLISQLLVAVLLTYFVLGREPFINLPVKQVRENLKLWPSFIRIGIPAAMQSIGFASISMYVARMIAGFGEAAIAAQKVGSQIESISWLTAEGFASALTAFISQNYGNKQLDRAKGGYRRAIFLISGIGLANSLLLYFGNEYIFSIFLTETAALAEGARYLRILAFSQLFMCLEMVASGAFNGFGKTLLPSLVVLAGVISRIPLGRVLSASSLGVSGIWWAISLSSIGMGIVLSIAMFIFLRRVQAYSDLPKRWRRQA